MSGAEDRRIPWSAQDVRATFFATNASARIDDLYEIAFEERPDSYLMKSSAGSATAQAKPTEPAQATGSGTLGQFTLLRNPNRFDLFLQPVEASFDAPPNALHDDLRHPLVKDVEVGITLIKDAAHRLCSNLSNISRVALSVTLAYPSPTNDAANIALSTILPYSIKLTNESDFTLQLNHRAVEDKYRIEYNSFSRWAVSPMQKINIVSGVSGNPQATAQIMQAYFLAQKSIDINSQPLARHLASDEVAALLDTFELQVVTLMTIS